MMAFDLADFYDAELRRLDERFRAAFEVGRRDRVLDIGCGAGQSALDAARAAVAGSVLGVDVSEELLRTARRRAAEAGLPNVAFERGDAQVQAFPGARFDLCISRFGAMFFADPVAAFANIGGAMRPEARLVLMVWQGRERNEWATAIPDALTPGGAPPAKTAPAFSLGDRAVTAGILAAAGFTAIDFAEAHEPVFYGATVDAAQEAIVALFLGADAPAVADVSADERLRRLRALLDARLTPEGVVFDSRAWVVTAQWAGRP